MTRYLSIYNGVFRHASRLLAGALLLCGASLTANAQGSGVLDRLSDALETVQDGLDLISENINMKDVRVRIGVGNGYVPDYFGSNNYRNRFLPIIDVRYKDKFHLNNGRLTVPLYRSGKFEAGPLVSLLLGRDENRNAALGGFGDINTTVQVGAYARYRAKTSLLEAEFRQALGAGQGSTVRLTVAQGFYRYKDLSLVFAARARWLSDKGAQTNFGITETQAANSTFGLPEFTANSGVSDINANIISAYQVNENVRLLGLVSYGRLLGDAANSPLASGTNGSGAGSSNQFIGGVAVSYQFN